MADRLYETLCKLIIFMQAEIGIALMPFQYKLAKRYLILFLCIYFKYRINLS